MVNDKMVNGFMKKKLYIIPLTEVASVKMSGVILTSPEPSVAGPQPPQGPAGAPARRTEVF